VQASVDLTRVIWFTIVFFDAKGGGYFWANRSPEAIEALTTLLDKALATGSGKKVYFRPKLEQLSIGIEPLKI
jgi:hypothetical protein